MESHGFYFFNYLPGFKYEDMPVWGASLAALGLIAGGIYTAKKLKKAPIVPSKKFSMATPFELICETLNGLQKSVIGAHSEKYLPLTGTVFFFVLACNLLGMIPGFKAPTESFFLNMSIALIVVVGTHYYGVRAQGAGTYAKHFLAPLAGIGGLVLSLLFTPIELVSHGFRLISLPLRLWGNISADHTVLHIMENLIPIGLPLPFMALGLMVAVVQAFIFSLLAMIYIALATAEDH